MVILHHLPLADLADTLRVVMPIIFVVIYGVAHLVGAMQKEKKKRDQRPRPQQQPMEFGRPERIGADRVGADRVGADPGLGKPASLEETLRREVEDFLKHAQGEPKPTQQQKRPTAPQRSRPAAAQKPRPQQPAEPSPRRLVDAPGSLTNRRAEPMVEVVPVAMPTGAAVDAYVTEQMHGVAAIGQHAQRLGEDVAQADDRMQAQLQQKFDHKLGTLAQSSASTVSPQAAIPGSTAAREFRDFLARPGGMRQMIIANEILRRPDERWDH